jgi:hypothetical protein
MERITACVNMSIGSVLGSFVCLFTRYLSGPHCCLTCAVFLLPPPFPFSFFSLPDVRHPCRREEGARRPPSWWAQQPCTPTPQIGIGFPWAWFCGCYGSIFCNEWDWLVFSLKLIWWREEISGGFMFHQCLLEGGIICSGRYSPLMQPSCSVLIIVFLEKFLW